MAKKVFEVFLSRTITQTATVEVSASSKEAARAAAKAEIADDSNFLTWEDPDDHDASNYEIDNIEEVE